MDNQQSDGQARIISVLILDGLGQCKPIDEIAAEIMAYLAQKPLPSCKTAERYH